MPFTVWLAAAAIGSSIPLAWWAINSDREMSDRVTRNLSQYESPTMRSAVLEHSAAERFVGPLAKSLGSKLLRFTPNGWVKSKQHSLGRAGLLGRLSPEQMLGAKISLGLFVTLMLGLRLADGFSTRGVLLAGSFVVVAFFVPDILVRAIADRRAEQITLLLPDVLDQLTISVEAGLGFEAALGRIAQHDDHALAQEFGRMLQDVQLGARRGAALNDMAHRTAVGDLRQVVLALRQAESLGVPLAKTLRVLSIEMREKRKFRAEERANKLPTKMIFPLGLCILPALFIVIIGPAIVSYLELF